MKMTTTFSPHFPFYSILLLSFLLHLVLILYSIHHDSHSSLKYTDIDYYVFTDAAHSILHPSSSPSSSSLLRVGSPYTRSTYRYTPLLALLLTPNHFLHPAFGKLLFSLADIVVGYLLYSLLLLRLPSSPSSESPTTTKNATLYTSLIWLLNPVVLNISTRGSSDSLLGLLVIGTLLLVEKKRWDAAAVVWAVSVHWKLFPAIYVASLVGALDEGRSKGVKQWWMDQRKWRFAFISALTFVGINAGCYAIWGPSFIHHTFTYHLSRQDHRHNFSPYFYPIYLSLASSSPSSSFLQILIRHPLSSFLPQLGLSSLLGWWFGKIDLGMAWWIQTVVFVAWNKVGTSQYFLWYLWLLPLILPRLNLSKTKGFTLLALWVIGQAIWLSQAYLLEIKGEPTYLRTWAAGVLFLGINVGLLGEVLGSYEAS